MPKEQSIGEFVASEFARREQEAIKKAVMAERKRIVYIISEMRHGANVARGGCYCSKPHQHKHNFTVEICDSILERIGGEGNG